MKTRTLLAGAFGLAMSLAAGLAAAEPADVMIPAGAGGGWDTTGRQAMQAMADSGVFADGANFTNTGGAAGTIGLAEFVNSQRRQRQRPDLHGRHHGGRHRAQQFAGHASTRPRRSPA